MAQNMRAAAQSIPGWASDSDPARRPGVPMEAEPRHAPGAHWDEPERQAARVEILKRVGQDELTPVFGSTLPPRGLSGRIRRYAYKIPEHKAMHWMALLAADRVDVIENGIPDLIARHPILSTFALTGIAAGIGGGALWVGRRKGA